MRKTLISAVILLIVIIASGVIFRHTNAQNGYKYDCTKEYHTTQLTCLDNMKTCTAQCDEAYPHDPEGAAARCKSICDTDRNSCDTRAADWYRECLGLNTFDKDILAPEQPPAQTIVRPPEPPTRLIKQPQDEIIRIDSDKIASFKTQVKEEAKKIIEMKKCPGSSLPSENPCVAEKLDFITIGARESLVSVSFLDTPKSSPEKQGNTGLITLGQNKSAEITAFFTNNTFPPTDPDKLDRIRNQILEMIEAGDTPPSWTGAILGPGHPVSVMDKEGNIKRFWKNMKVNDGEGFQLSLVGNVSISSSGKPFKPLEPLGGFITVKTAAEILVPSAIITGDTPAQIITPDETIVDVASRSGIGVHAKGLDASPPPPGWPDWMYDVFYGTIYVLKKEDSRAVDVRTPLTITKSKHTKFAVVYNPEELYAATIAYEGEVEVTDILNGLVTTLTPTDDGKPRVLVVPLVETEVATKKTGATWIIIILALLAGIGYLAYRKKDIVQKIIKKESKS